MGSQAKVLIPVGLIGLVVAGLTFWRLGLVAGIAVLVVAALAVVAIAQREADGGTFTRHGGRDDLFADLSHDDLSHDDLGHDDVDHRRRDLGGLPADLGVDQPLGTWTPPAPPTAPVPDGPSAFAGRPFGDDTLDRADDLPFVDEAPLAEAPFTEAPFTEPGPAEPASPWADGGSWGEGGRTAERNPLDELVGLDEVDVVAEVERLEAGGPRAFERDLDQIDDGVLADVVPFEKHRVNEEVASPDDILAASHATELAVEGPADNSELARLLAKVQARLAAYE